MSDNTDTTNESLAAFQKIWMESMAKMAQAGFPLSAGPPPPEVVREIRNGMFRSMSQSWEAYMRSPQFLESMKQSMDQAINLRRLTNEFLGKARNEMQAPSLDDLNSAMLAIRHTERRMLDRMDELSAQVKELSDRLPPLPRKAAAAKANGPNARPPRGIQAPHHQKGGGSMNSQVDYSNPWIQWQRSTAEEAVAAAGRLACLPAIFGQAQRVKKGVTTSEVVYEEDRLKLLHYLGDGKPRHRTPLVFIYALVNRPYILDLKKGRSVVANFVDRGFDTYLVDWGAPMRADRYLTLEDYINGYMANVIDYVCERTGVETLNVLGYCMGGTMSAMYTALHSDRVKNLILLAAPIDFASNDSLLSIWSRPEYFDVDKFVDTFGNCPPEMLQAAFTLLKPVSNLVEKPLNFYEHMDDPRFIEDFLTTEGWLNDNIAVPGEVYREFIKYLYQKNLLTQNRMPVGKHIVNLRNITCPTLNIMAGSDDLVPCSQGIPFTDLVGSKDRKTILLEGSGHIGLAIGGRAQKEVWPQACEWLATRSE